MTTFCKEVHEEANYLVFSIYCNIYIYSLRYFIYNMLEYTLKKTSSSLLDVFLFKGNIEFYG